MRCHQMPSDTEWRLQDACIAHIFTLPGQGNIAKNFIMATSKGSTSFREQQVQTDYIVIQRQFQFRKQEEKLTDHFPFQLQCINATDKS